MVKRIRISVGSKKQIKSMRGLVGGREDKRIRGLLYGKNG